MLPGDPPSERVRNMPEKPSEKKPVPAAVAVGMRVLVRRESEEAQAGEIVEDYAALTGTQRGHEWAPVHRWAVALDDGRLVFADTENLTADPGAQQSGPRTSPPR
jgi:hypothetical protein